MDFNRDKPFNSLPLLPPNADIETKPILKQAIKASRELAELKKAGNLIPNQEVLINTIPLLEAQGSSEIENIVTTTDKLFLLSSKESAEADPATKEALRYRTALREGYEIQKNRPINTNTAIRICRTILNIDLDIRKTPGTRLTNKATGETIYTPPESENIIRDILANWEWFANESTDIDPLIRMAVMHYQFESIHPFTDGNGRTGRILNILFLIQQGLLELPVLYLSRYFLNNRTDYYNLIRGVTERQEWDPWILFMLKAVEQTALWTSQKILAIRELFTHTCEYLKKRAPFYSRELVEIIFIQPYCRIENLVISGIAKRQTASTYLKYLEDYGVLKEERHGRGKLYIHPAFLRLLTMDKNEIERYDK
jgi:Fic family protein